MDKPKALDSLFKQKIFRIPDYQRGYAWQREQLKAFWEDLVNLSGERSHYTGVLTLKQICEIPANVKEHWLVEDYSYEVYHEERLCGRFSFGDRGRPELVVGTAGNKGSRNKTAEVYGITLGLSIQGWCGPRAVVISRPR